MAKSKPDLYAKRDRAVSQVQYYLSALYLLPFCFGQGSTPDLDQDTGRKAGIIQAQLEQALKVLQGLKHLNDPALAGKIDKVERDVRQLKADTDALLEDFFQACSDEAKAVITSDYASNNYLRVVWSEFRARSAPSTTPISVGSSRQFRMRVSGDVKAVSKQSTHMTVFAARNATQTPRSSRGGSECTQSPIKCILSSNFTAFSWDIVLNIIAFEEAKIVDLLFCKPPVSRF
ncbi:hypothetical protein H0H93_011194 [Arthromyces matolae]|nr:hypothetical protein H0H93_011194 [Arthromyces matolae]